MQRTQAESPAPLRWGLIGASAIAADWMIPAIRAVRGARIVAVMSRDAARGAAFADAQGIPDVVTTVDALLEKGIDAVYISSTNERHAAEAIACARAGRHVLSEKPIALPLADAMAVVEAARNAGVVLATNHHIRNTECIRTIRALLHEGRIGRVVSARVANAFALPAKLQGWRIDAPAGGGAIFDVGVHMADSLRYIHRREPIDMVATMGSVGMAKGGVDDNAMAIARFEGDLGVSLHVGFAAPFVDRVWEFLGTDGALIGTNPNIPVPGARLVLRNAQGVQEIGFAHANPYERGVAQFCAAVAGDGRPAATGEDGVRSLAFALAWIDAARHGRRTRIVTPLDAHDPRPLDATGPLPGANTP
jgi:1,5-anhydro-D-fructose reductase (1,5-anhydro-D-mannitol-forming)